MDSSSNSASILKEISVLEVNLKMLSVGDSHCQQQISSTTFVADSPLNDIRAALKTISSCTTLLETAPEIIQLHDALKKPLSTYSGDGDGDTFGLLSFLKLLAEMSPTPTNPPVEIGVEAVLQEDTFWKQVIEPICPDIFVFLNDCVFKKCLAAFSSPLSCASNPDGGVETSYHGTGFAFHQQLGILQKGVRVLLIFLKRAIVSVTATADLANHIKRPLEASITEMLHNLCALMNPKEKNGSSDFDIGLDVRCNVGVAICYSTYYLKHPDKNHIQSFFRLIFDNSLKENLNTLSDVENSILEVASSDVNRLAIAFGILNTWLDQEHDSRLYFSIAKNVLDIEHGVKEAVNLGSSRALEIWTDKLARPTMPVEILKHVSSLFAPLEFFCFMYMPGHIDAVKNCCRNILSSLSIIYDRLDEVGVPCLQQHQTWVSALLHTILEKPGHIKWIALSCVARNTKKSLKVLQIEREIPTWLLLAKRTAKNAANDTYVALMSYHFYTASETEWEKTWIDPLFLSQLPLNNESNWPQKKNIISMILNSEKLRLQHLQVMIKPLLKIVVRRMNCSSGKENDQNTDRLTIPEASLLAAETVKMAFDMKLAVDSSDKLVDSAETSFRGLVSRAVLHNWLCSENAQIRLAGFALLVEARKTSEIIPKEDLESLKIFLKYNLLSQNPAFRQQFFSYFKKLVRRLKDSDSSARRKKDTETVKQYDQFLPWLWNFLTVEEGLFCGANFGRRCQALECLSELTSVFPTFEIFGVTKDSGNTKYLRWLVDSYENNKIQALEVLVRMPIQEFEDETFCQKLFNEGLNFCKSIKPPDSVTGRYLITLLMRKCSSYNATYSPWSILQTLYRELEQIYHRIHATSLIQVSSETPLYGCVRCIRMILENTKEFKQKENALKYRDYIRKLLKLCFQIDTVLFPVLGNAAPEGFLPGLKDSSEDNKQVVRSLSAQMLLVCAWRTMKENCLLMSDMCSLFVMEGESGFIGGDGRKNLASDYLLTVEQVSEIGEHLLFLLKNLMHRGVFEQVFVGFKMIANRLWKSSNKLLSNLPEKWLQDAMDQEHISAKSITRRSGGLPFIFQALLSAESDNEAFLHKWLQRLFVYDEIQSPEMTSIRIHSMNVLRGLFRDASFSTAMMPFVPHGLKMAFRGLKSTDWTERNSGLMLYGAVMRRSFGAKLNLMNAPTFFRKFPQMYDFLLMELDICMDLMKQRKEEREGKRESGPLTCDFTFHLLLLLSSFTACGRVEDTHFKLAEFIPRIRKCGDSDDMEVRKLAAKALVPFLVSPEDYRKIAETVLNELRSQPKMSQNKLHGLLFQFLIITTHLPREDTSACRDANRLLILSFINHVCTTSSLSTFKAPTVYEVALDILIVLHSMKCVERGVIFEAVELVETSYYQRFRINIERNLVPGLLIADKAVAHAVIEISADELETEMFLEKMYNYFSTNALAHIEQFLELLQKKSRIASLLCDETSVEALVLVEMVIVQYLERVISMFTKFPGTDLELGYLRCLGKVSALVFEACYFQDGKETLEKLLERLFKICDDVESTTLQIKSMAMMVLGKIAFSTLVPISQKNQTTLCNIVLRWSASGMDDDLRFAIAESFPAIPCINVSKFSGLNQAKIWSSIFMLFQDDESFLRKIMNRKLAETKDSPCCDRRSLEILTKIYFHQYLPDNPIEGLLVLIGLLLREDFEVEAKAADDESEDRLFDKSEMNMYFEHPTLAKVIRAQLESNGYCVHPSLKSSLDVALSADQISLFKIVSNTNSDNFDSDVNNFSGICIRQILEVESNRIMDNNDCDTNIGDSIILSRSINDFVKVCIYAFLRDFLLILSGTNSTQ